MVWAGFIYFLSSIPSLNSGFDLWVFFLRKGAHIFEFAVLTALLLRALSSTFTSWATKKLMTLSGVVAVLYAMSDEFHQSFVPGRGPSVIDVCIDGIGVAVVLYFFYKRSQVTV